MKFQLKALAAALALAATLPAHAMVDKAVTGDGSLVLTVFDRSNNLSATFDLGKHYSDFSIVGTSFANSGADAAGVNYAWDLSTGDYATAWNQFFSTANLANTVWAIGAGDNGGAFANGGRGFITTYSAVGANITTQQVQALAGNHDNYVDANTISSGAGSALWQNHNDHPLGADANNPGRVENGSSVANSGIAFGGTYYNGGRNFNVGATAIGAIGADLGVLQYVTGASAFAVGPSTIFGNGAKFNLASNGALVYSTIAAVPEADSWAMMLLGLGFMGFIARRKSV